MKISNVFVLGTVLVLSTQVFASGQYKQTFTDKLNYDEVANAKGVAAGLKGSAPVELSLTISSPALGFRGYQETKVCTSYSEPTIPRHPETADCLKEETHWVPRVTLLAGKIANLSLSGSGIGALDTAEMDLGPECIVNLKDVTVVGGAYPAPPADIIIKANCSANLYLSTRADIDYRFAGNNTLNVRVNMGAKVSWSAPADIHAVFAAPAPPAVEIKSIAIIPGQADFFSDLFKYDARLFLAGTPSYRIL